MLKTIDPLLGPDLLQVLAAMGHGDDLVLVDANFPADSVARHTVSGRLVRLDGAGVVRAAKAILSVFPLDSFVEPACWRMEVVGDPNAFPDVHQEVQEVIDQAEERGFPLAPIEREFIKMVYSRQGQDVVAKDGYIPLPPSVIERMSTTLGL